MNINEIIYWGIHLVSIFYIYGFYNSDLKLS